MSVCKHIYNCPIYLGKADSQFMSITALQREVYCTGDHEQCVRYLIKKALAVEEIPDDLQPDDRQKMHELIIQLSGAKKAI